MWFLRQLIISLLGTEQTDMERPSMPYLAFAKWTFSQHHFQSHLFNPGVSTSRPPHAGTYLCRMELGSPRRPHSRGWRCRSGWRGHPRRSQRDSCIESCLLCWIVSRGGLPSGFPQDFHMCGWVKLLGRKKKRKKHKLKEDFLLTSVYITKHRPHLNYLSYQI